MVGAIVPNDIRSVLNTIGKINITEKFPFFE